MRSSEGVENQDVYLTFSPNFERIWLEAKKRLPEYVSQKLANLGLRSQYSIRLYGWVKKHVTSGTTHFAGAAPKLLGLESVKDAEGKIIQEAPLPVWANFRQRALDTAIAEITKKTDISIAIESLARSKYRRATSVTFSIEAQAVPNSQLLERDHE
jgi:plasmid replication initiation protein